MDRIKEALERARKERAESVDKLESHETRVARVHSTQIDYQKTRVVEVSNKSLIQKRVIVGDRHHPATTAYKVLRTKVLRRMQEKGWNTLAITGPVGIEGKSLTAVNLAISVAQQFTGTVLLVDLDLRRSSISSYFGYKPAQGLTDHLLNGVALHDALFNPGIQRLVILPAGTPIPNVSELLRSPEILSFIRELKARYQDRYVLFDLPPLLAGDDALNILPCVDCALMVVADGETKPDEVVSALEVLEGTECIGTVLNKCKDPSINFNYQYY